MKTPQSCKGFQGMLELAATTKVVGQQFKLYDRKKWNILGWLAGFPDKGELLIVLDELASA